MYEHNIRRQNKSKPYINGKVNFDPENHQLKKAPIKRLLEQKTVQKTVTTNGEQYLYNLNVLGDAVELVQTYLENKTNRKTSNTTRSQKQSNHRNRRHTIRTKKNHRRNPKMNIKLFKLKIKTYKQYIGLKKLKQHLDISLGKIELKITY